MIPGVKYEGSSVEPGRTWCSAQTQVRAQHAGDQQVHQICQGSGTCIHSRLTSRQTLKDKRQTCLLSLFMLCVFSTGGIIRYCEYLLMYLNGWRGPSSKWTFVEVHFGRNLAYNKNVDYNKLVETGN